MTRRRARRVRVGGIWLGGDEPVRVQSMLSVRADDIPASVAQALALERAGCELIRAAVPDMPAVRLIAELKESLSVPVVADIHFDHRLAVESVAAGADKIRINPGNIGGRDRVKAVASACRERGVPIRIGVNSGSVEREILARHGAPTPEALCESAMYHAALLEALDFGDIVISVKSSDVPSTVRSCELVARACDYPLHIGVTEAGTPGTGVIKSSVGIGALLLEGIGDTIRVSLTGDPLEEVAAGYGILRAAGLKNDRPTIISCPTCGRTRIDIAALAAEVERRLDGCTLPIKIAVMGCAVNGPGEAREADIGIAGGDGCAVIFKRGELLRRVDEEDVVDELMAELARLES